MARSSDTVMVLNDYGFTKRTSTTGRTRYTVTIKSEPILVNTDPRALTRGPAEAIAAHLRTRITGINATASPATLRAREVAEKALAAGKPWARQRYAGGRIGQRQPGQSDNLFNDSGRFAESIAVGAVKDGWVINVAANRLDARTFRGGEAGLLAMVEQLKRFVPEFGDAKRLAEVLPVRRAVNEAVAGMLKKASERTVDLEIARMKAAISAIQSAAGALRSLAG